MSTLTVTEITDLSQAKDLAARVLKGEVFVIRQGLQLAGLFDTMLEDAHQGLKNHSGEDFANKAKEIGYDRIHELVDPADLPGLTDAVYDTVSARAPEFVEKFVKAWFPEHAENYYYEKKPNARFHIPYELTAKHQALYAKFAKEHGAGKIAPHGPHKDSWLDCPSNVVNAWIAVGDVLEGNGLTVFNKDYNKDFKYNEHGEIAYGEKLSEPFCCDLKAGDLILFLSDQIHGSVLNRTDRTRFVVSYRIGAQKPHFPNGHYHHYVKGGLAGSSLDFISAVPANLQGSYFKTKARFAVEKLSGSKKPRGVVTKPIEGGPVSEDEFPVGSIKPLDRKTCAARLSNGELVAFSRTCPHKGADLSDGWVIGDQVVCPWHNLNFDPKTGESPCSVLKIKPAECEVVDGKVQVKANAPSA